MSRGGAWKCPKAARGVNAYYKPWSSVNDHRLPLFVLFNNLYAPLTLKSTNNRDNYKGRGQVKIAHYFFILVIPSYMVYVKIIIFKKWRWLPPLRSAHSQKSIRTLCWGFMFNCPWKKSLISKCKTDSKPGRNENYFGLLLSLTSIVFQANNKRKILIKNQNISEYIGTRVQSK